MKNANEEILLSPRHRKDGHGSVVSPYDWV